ncbi:hypothetical protein [Blastococcus brunescens]|uniref:Uncharacterized protein n=1 Tax=Blastococcus brunescens TaxID=1564165 RepID=A0ABZ1BAQ6_9ACTN|nr:hypothetical protein [Blastococcus sp. BMG 8361]WRL67356.1 hypothetical protein U6N30_07835 [Blastococcus sp. BMG 8361]
MTPRWSWVDLRLVPAAAAIWGTTLLAPSGATVTLAGAVLAACLLAVLVRRAHGPATAVLLIVLAGWRSPRRRRRSGEPPVTARPFGPPQRESGP